MKKKLATLLLFMFSSFSVLTGCNLFSTNNSTGLGSIVAKSGEIEITREQLINAYNSSGFQYNQYYGLSMQEALEKTINDLIDREYLLKHIAEEEKTNPALKLGQAEVYSVIKTTWQNIDSSLETIAEQVRAEIKQTTSSEVEEETESEENEYKGYAPYQTKFFVDANGIYKKIGDSVTDYVPEITENTKYEYQMNISSEDEDFKAIVWNRFISNLKSNEEIYNYSNKTEEAVFKRFIDKIYKSNLENAKLSKFEQLYKDTFGVDYNDVAGQYYVNSTTLGQMLEKYKSIYDSNKSFYDLTRNISSTSDLFYSQVSNSSARDKFVYYGEGDEELLTCLHVLVKFDEKSQTEKIKQINDDANLPQADRDTAIKQLKSTEKTPAFERDIETGAVVSDVPTSVQQVYQLILADLTNISYNPGTAEYAEEAIKIFNKYIYKYNQDSGIINAKYDYIVGTKTSGMVASFTEVVRELAALDENTKQEKINTNYVQQQAEYNKDVTLVFPNGVGYAGAVSAPFLEEASNYTGYHIVLYTGKLKSIAANTLTEDNLFEKLSKAKTSVAYNQNYFEYLYDLVAKDNYSTHISDIVSSIKVAPEYTSANYSDLY
ncbi:MAG: hypothetical protein IJD48_03860 [Clostridia bacterium]|nr:hypothetical protein [Clostridia bacterium]